MASRWSNIEIDILRTYYSFQYNVCYTMLSDRSKYAIIQKAHDLGIKYHAWTDDEIELLKKHYPTGGSTICAQFINRLLSAIRCKAHEIGIGTECKNGKTVSHPVIFIIEGNRVVATCPYHGNVEHRFKKHNRGPVCKLCRRDYSKLAVVKKSNAQWQKQRLTNPKWLYAHRLRVQLRLAIRNKQLGCFRLLPYSPNELRNHLKMISQQQHNRCPSCNTSYNLVKFQIDHIIPLASVDNDKATFDLFALDNLSLLCGSCNSRKGKRT